MKRNVLIAIVVTLALLAAAVLVARFAGPQLLQTQAVQTLPRGLVLQEGGAETAAGVRVTMAAKRWTAAHGTGYIDRELATAARLGVKLLVGWVWQNETYTGAPSALPPDWPKVCWTGDQPGCRPNYADAGARSKALQSIRNLGRYDGHAQIAGIMANVGDDGERRFCKHPTSGDPCFEAYRAAGLDNRIWQQFVADVARVYAETFTRTPVVFHYAGLGFHAAEIGRDAGVAVGYGLGLMSSGLYPVMCSGNSYGGVCNPTNPLLNDWQIPGTYPTAPLALEQSLAYGDGQAALAWLWAVAHGAEQIHAQKVTLQGSIGTEWRESAEYLLAHPEAALWVAMEPSASICQKVGRPLYCPELGNWSRNVTQVEAGALGYNVGATYMGWVARKGPVTLRTTLSGPVTVIVWQADGARREWEQDSGSLVQVDGTAYVHRVEVRPAGATVPEATLTALPLSTPTATRPATVKPTATRTVAAPSTLTPTATVTATPDAPAVRWHVTGTVGEWPVDLWIEAE